MRISDWSSDVCSSDLVAAGQASPWQARFWEHTIRDERDLQAHVDYVHVNPLKHGLVTRVVDWPYSSFHRHVRQGLAAADWAGKVEAGAFGRSEEHTSELQSLMRISYAVFCLKKKKHTQTTHLNQYT